MNSVEYQNQYTSLEPINIGTSTFWIVDEDHASAYVPIESHSVEFPGQKPSHSIFSTQNRIQVVLQSDSWEGREELVLLCEKLENREVEFGFDVNEKFVGTWKGRIYNDIPQLFGQMEPNYSWYVGFQLASLIPQEIFLETSSGRSWFADIENQRMNFFCTDQRILDWFLEAKKYLPKYLPVGCYFENMHPRLSICVEIERDCCAIVVWLAGGGGEKQTYYGWQSDHLNSEPSDKLENIGELEVPVGAVLNHKRGLEVLRFVLAQRKELVEHGIDSEVTILKQV